MSTLLPLLLFFATANTPAQEDAIGDDIVHFEFMPYLVLAGTSGDMTIRNQTRPVNASAGETLSHLQFGFMERSAVSLNRWYAGTDLTYMGLGGSIPLVNVGMDQWGGAGGGALTAEAIASRIV